MGLNSLERIRYLLSKETFTSEDGVEVVDIDGLIDCLESPSYEFDEYGEVVVPEQLDEEMKGVENYITGMAGS